MPSLEKSLRNQLERAVKDARDIAEAGAKAALEAMGVGEAGPPSHLNDEDRDLRRRLRIHGRQLGDLPDEKKKTQELDRLIEEVGYEHWHRMLFARFLAENSLLMYDESFQFSVLSVQQEDRLKTDPLKTENLVAISLEEAEDLAIEHGLRNKWDLAAQLATRMLPQIFRVDSPVFEILLPPENQQQLEKLINGLPVEVFTASDSLGWVYQFWQARRKEQVNESEVKIGARELPAVTQLFTEDYMVDFLLDNTLGAWWAGKKGVDSFQCSVFSEEADVQSAVALPGCPWNYLRFIQTDPNQPPGVSPRLPADDDQQPDANALRLMWTPAAGSFDGWPKTASELKCLDPCMGSGHFVVAMFERLVALRMAEEQLDEAASVSAVIRDNLFGLEIDPRCTQIAAFNLALAAWRRVGYRVLPAMNLACSGVGPECTVDEWLTLAEQSAQPMTVLSREPIENGLRNLHELFSEAPTLGSLIDPNQLSATMFAADYETLLPFLNAAMAAERDSCSLTLRVEPSGSNTRLGESSYDETTHERAVAAAGMVKAAELLAGQYTLVITNVPYLGRGKQDETLRKHLEQHFPHSKADLATAFVERCLEFCAKSGTTALVTPQNWLFLGTYKKLRAGLLEQMSWNLVTRLGANAFQDMNWWAATTALVAISAQRPSTVHSFAGLDVTDARYPDDKPDAVRSNQLSALSQTGQLANPDCKITLEVRGVHHAMREFAISYQGTKTGDDERMRRKFWEFVAGAERWRLFQSTVSEHTPYGGRESVVDWRRNGTDFSRLQGLGAISQLGVAVGQMRLLPVTIYTGELFDSNVAPIVVREPDQLAALWMYCSSEEFVASVRTLDQKVAVANATFLQVPFDVAHWRKAALEKYPDGLPEPESDNPTQWLFHGRPESSTCPLQVAVARLLGYRWPAEFSLSGKALAAGSVERRDGVDSANQEPDAKEPAANAVRLITPACDMRLSARARALVESCDALWKFADTDGIVCIPPVRGESGAADRLLNLLSESFQCSVFSVQQDKETESQKSENFSTYVNRLLRDAGYAGKSLETWLRDGFFAQHIDLFHKRPFVWHVWDGLRDGFAALVNYHKLDRKNLETLIYTYLGDWITRCESADKDNGLTEDGEKVTAAKNLKRKLEQILEGEAPYDIFVRWKPLPQQAIGWEPDLNDGVRMNIRPFLSVPDVKVRGAGILRVKPNIKWDKDRGKEPQRSKDDYPWFWGWDGKTTDFPGGPEFKGERFNDCHYTLARKRKARE